MIVRNVYIYPAMKKFFTKYKSAILRGFFELLIIFAGISISLLIDDWRQRRADEELAMEYLRLMYVDVTEDLENLAESAMASRISKMDDCRVLLSAMHYPDSVTLSDEDFRHKFAWVLRLDKFVSSDNTYRDLISTGNFKLITNSAIKDNIYTYYKTLEELNDIVEIWVDAALRLDERNLKVMERLVRAQNTKVSADVSSLHEKQSA